MPGRRPSGVRPVYAACPISPISPISPASSGGRGAVGKVFSRLNPFSVFLPLWAGRGCPGGDARTTFPYFGSRKHPVSPGRVQRRRPVRVLPRRERLRGAVSAAPCAMQVCLRGGPMRNISSKEEAVFRRAGCRGEDRFGFCRDGERPRGACRCRRSVCSAGLPSGRSDAEYILERRSCFSPGRAQSRGLSDRIEEREATARTSRFFVSVPAADAACGARPGRAASAAGGCGSRPRRAALRESADA